MYRTLKKCFVYSFMSHTEDNVQTNTDDYKSDGGYGGVDYA